MLKYLLLAALPAFLAVPAATGAATPQTWIYVLRLEPRLHDEAAWTEKDQKVVGEHFAHLQQLTAQRVVILAGRTNEPQDRTFGIVIFEAAGEEAARALMSADPAVREKVMTATLHPFDVALQRQPDQTSGDGQ